MSDTFCKEHNDSQWLAAKAGALKEKAEELERLIRETEGREASLAITNLEQSVMWAVKAIYKS